MNKTTDRKYSLDFLKFFSIYWVVLIQHNFAPLGDGVDWHWIAGGELFVVETAFLNFFTPYTMPICFMISGLVAGFTNTFFRYDFKTFFLGKFKRLYLPCIVLGGVFCLIKDHTLLNPRIFLKGYMHFWFVGYLFWFFMMSYWLVRKFGNYIFIIPILFLLLSVLLYAADFDLKTPLTFCENFLYFSTGFCIYLYSNNLKMKWVVPLLFSVVLFLFLDFTFESPIFKLCRVLCVCITILLYAIETNMITKRLQFLFKTSYGVYLFHLIVLWLLYQLVIVVGAGALVVENPWIMCSILAVCSLFISIGLTVLSNKYNFLYI